MKAHKAEATLKVIVLDKKTVKVAIRPVQVRNDKQLLSLGNAADPKKLLDEMNAIWNPQANVYFELGRTDPATIDGLSPQAEAIERHDDSVSDRDHLRAAGNQEWSELARVVHCEAPAQLCARFEVAWFSDSRVRHGSCRPSGQS